MSPLRTMAVIIKRLSTIDRRRGSFKCLMLLLSERVSSSPAMSFCDFVRKLVLLRSARFYFNYISLLFYVLFSNAICFQIDF